MLRAVLGDTVEDAGGYIAEVVYGANDGIVTTFAVVAGVAGWTPLVPYTLAVEARFALSIAVTAVAFFAVGASRRLVTDRPWYAAGAEMFVVGMVAAGVAFAAGVGLSGLA